jgi:hypothetical protein
LNLNLSAMIAFKWLVVILTVALSALFIYLTGKNEK